MAAQRKNEESQGLLIRGADGALYLLAGNDLTPYKLKEKQAASVRRVLKKEHVDPIVSKFNDKIVKELRALGSCINDDDTQTTVTARFFRQY